MTTRECAIVEAYTGATMLIKDRRNIFYKYIENLCGRPVYTHELASPEMQRFIQAKSKPDFIELCANATEE